ncbi:MAG: helix-turn-helix domain-containing protein [Pseudomonadota bacterium]|nr:helix-turn-helix domain-containing protein [Tepidimonas thermarum]
MAGWCAAGQRAGCPKTTPSWVNRCCSVSSSTRWWRAGARVVSAGSIGRAAELLGVSRKTLWEKMKRLAIES